MKEGIPVSKITNTKRFRKLLRNEIDKDIINRLKSFAKKHHVYIVSCSDNTFYTGYSTDVTKRIQKHNSGKGAKYTKTRLPVILLHTESFDTKSEALKREYQIKQLSRKEKSKLIYDPTRKI